MQDWLTSRWKLSGSRAVLDLRRTLGSLSGGAPLAPTEYILICQNVAPEIKRAISKMGVSLRLFPRALGVPPQRPPVTREGEFCNAGATFRSLPCPAFLKCTPVILKCVPYVLRRIVLLLKSTKWSAFPPALISTSQVCALDDC